MWFRRRRRRPQLDLAALDRLSDSISRAVALIEEKLAPTPPAAERRRPVELVIRRSPDEPGPDPEPDPEPELDPQPEREPRPEPASEPQPKTAPEPDQPEGFVLFVPTSSGYRLVNDGDLTPQRGERLRVEAEWYRVLRLGPSPLPGDSRRCAYLEHAFFEHEEATLA
jgi:hypothetical protein